MGLYAQIQNNTITNVVACDSTFASAHGLTEIDALNPVPGIGWTLSAGTWSPPVPPTPTTAQQNQQTLESRAQTALTNNQTFLAISSPTNTQSVAQVQALTRQVDGIIRLLLGLLDTITDS